MEHSEIDNSIVFSIAESFELDANHPGKADPEYIFRRRFFHSLCHAHRISGAEAPLIAYTDNERILWREVLILLEDLHAAHACKQYLVGKRALNISPNSIPQTRTLSRLLRSKTGFGLAPAEGLLHFREFFALIGSGSLPCTQYLRHHSSPAFTPEPDMVHDLLGHVPLLVDHDVITSMRAIGWAAQRADPDQLLKLTRLYWFGIEFGLIEERNDVRIYGAGILSSNGEIQHSLSSAVTRKPFVLEQVITTEYDPTRFQDTLFVASSLKQLRDATLELVSGFNFVEKFAA